MVPDVPSQPQCLTLIELTLSYALYGGIGYLIAGQTGLWCGVGLITFLYGYRIWRVALLPQPSRDAERKPDA